MVQSMPTIDRLEGLVARLETIGIRSHPVLELPYLDWVKLVNAIELETRLPLEGHGMIEGAELVTRGCWFYAAGVKIRSCG